MENYDADNSMPWLEQTSEIKKVVIGEGITSISDSAFCGCNNLNAVTIPESVTAIGQSAFWYCTKLTDITIPKGVTRLNEDTFNGCDELGDFTVPENVTSIGVGALCFSNGRLFSVTILNPDCSIETSDTAVTIASSVIFGYAGSTAERFVNEHGKFFEVIEN